MYKNDVNRLCVYVSQTATTTACRQTTATFCADSDLRSRDTRSTSEAATRSGPSGRRVSTTGRGVAATPLRRPRPPGTVRRRPPRRSSRNRASGHSRTWQRRRRRRRVDVGRLRRPSPPTPGPLVLRRRCRSAPRRRRSRCRRCRPVSSRGRTASRRGRTGRGFSLHRRPRRRRPRPPPIARSPRSPTGCCGTRPTRWWSAPAVIPRRTRPSRTSWRRPPPLTPPPSTPPYRPASRRR